MVIRHKGLCKLLYRILAISLVVIGSTALALAAENQGKEVVVAVWSGPEADALKDMAPSFEQQTGYKLIIDEVARDAWRTKVSTVLLSGSKTWDVINLNGEWLPEFAEAGTLEPLEGNVPESTFVQLSGLVNTSYGGKIYGVPEGYHSLYLYYRKDWLKDAGLDVPQTWDDFLQAAKAMTKNGQYGTVIRGGLGGNSIHMEFATFFLGFGGQWVDSDFKPIMNQKNGVEALTYFCDLLNVHKVVPPDAQAVGYLEKNQYYQAGKVGMMLQWAAAYTEILDPSLSPKVYDVTGVALIPGRLIDGEIRRGAQASCQAWVVPKTAPNKKSAMDFITWIASFDGSKEWVLRGGSPGNLSVYSDPEVRSYREDAALHAQTMEFAGLPPRIPQTNELIEIWSKHINLALVRKETPQEALDKVAQEWEVILRKGGFLK
jgi:multiple sugar transport system substrate-binding protein